MILWSRRFYPKVFGGIFCFVALSVEARADKTSEALSAAKTAALISSGIKRRMDETKKDYETVLINKTKEMNIEQPVVAIGIALKVVRDKGISFNYRGKSFSVTPHSIFMGLTF